VTEIVGREADLQAIRRWFAIAGPATLVVEGAAGLGKTTVWSAAVEAIRATGARVLTSSPTEAESELSYSGLADLLADALADLRRELPPPQARALAVAMRLEDPGDRPADETAVTRGALEALHALGRRGRLLVAIDDLRWLDAPSLTVIGYVARRLAPGGPVRLLTTHRSGAPYPGPLADPAAAVEHLRLEPLSVGGIHRIIRVQTGIVLARPRLLEVHAASAGNPLHAVELARALEMGGAPDGSLASLYGARIAALPAATREALVLLGASADRTVERLERAAPGFADVVAPAVADGLVAIARGRAQPAHPLVSHVAYDDATPPARRSAHARLAASASSDEERGLHLGRSVDGFDPGAAAAIESAAREARARGVRALSAALFESAARITPDDALDDVARRWLAAATAWFDAGDTHRVDQILRPLISRLPRGAQRAESRWRLGIALDEAGQWREAMALWRAALDDTDEAALRSQVRCSLSITAMYTDTTAVALDWSRDAVTDAESSADPAAIARSLAVDAFIHAIAGRPADQARMERALAIEATIDEHLGEWSPAAMAAECARHAGDIHGAIRHYRVVLDRAVARGDANVEQWAAFGLGQAEVMAGMFAEAAVLADVVLDIADQTDVMRIPARSLRAHVDAWLGRFDSARTHVGEALAMARAADEATHTFGALVVLATIESFAGDAAAAADAHAAARALASELGLRHATALRIHLHEAEAAAAAGRLERARAALVEAGELMGGDLPAWAQPVADRARAAIHLADGDAATAVDDLERAVADAGSLAPDRGRAWLALGRALRQRREVRRSREATEQALGVFEALGSPPWIDAARVELARLPGRRPWTDGELTNAEAAIARLVAAGGSNREVAAELVLSVKTVEVTLTRVYEKLGLRSRTQLAAHFRERAEEPL